MNTGHILFLLIGAWRSGCPAQRRCCYSTCHESRCRKSAWLGKGVSQITYREWILQVILHWFHNYFLFICPDCYNTLSYISPKTGGLLPLLIIWALLCQIYKHMMKFKHEVWKYNLFSSFFRLSESIFYPAATFISPKIGYNNNMKIKWAW